MNLLLQALMDKPSLRPGYCVLCGATPVTGHHPVPRSQGGVDGPVLDLCGSGTTKHHGDAEDKRLHFRFTDAWEALMTAVPTKYERALDLPGWRPL